MSTLPELNQFYRLKETGTIVLVNGVGRLNLDVYDSVYEQYITLHQHDAARILDDKALSQDDVRLEMARSSKGISYALEKMLRMQADFPTSETPQQLSSQ